MMTPMIKHSDPTSDSDGTDTPLHTKSNNNFTLKHFTNTKYKLKIKSKIYYLKSKDIMQRPSLKNLFC